MVGLVNRVRAWATFIVLAGAAAAWAADSKAPAGAEPRAVAAAAAAAASAAPSTGPVTQGLKSLNEPLGEAVTLASRVTILLAVAMGAWLLVQEWRRSALVIEPFEVAKPLADQGLSGVVVSQLLSDAILDLQRSARVDDDPADITFVELPKFQVDLQLPGIAWSVRGVIRYLKQCLGRSENRLFGEVVQVGDGFAMRLRTAAGAAREVPCRFQGTQDSGPAIQSAAETALLLMNPFEAATIFWTQESFTTGYAKTTAALKTWLATAPSKEHQRAYVLWASVHRSLGQADQMRGKLELARAATASVWLGQSEGPLGSRYLNFVGSVHREAAEFRQAQSCFESALRLDARNLGAMTNLGLLCHDTWQLPQAQTWFRRVVRSRPNSSRGYRGLGLVALKSKRWDEALRWFDRAVDVAPLARWPRVNRIDALRRMGRFEQAEDAIVEFQSLDKRFPPFFRAWGDLLRDRQRFAQALARYDEAAALNPGDPWVFSARAEVLRRMGRYQEAQEAIDKALALRPGHFGLIHTRLGILAECGPSNPSLAELWACRQAWWHEPSVHARLANELIRRCQFGEAAKVLRAVPPHCEDTVEVLRARGRLCLESGDPLAAESLHAAAVRADSCEPWAQVDFIGSLLRNEQQERAYQAAQALLAQWPEMAAAWRCAADCLQALGRRREAEEALQKAFTLCEPTHQGRLSAMLLLHRLGRFEEAIDLARGLSETHPHDPEPLRRWGEALRGQGKEDESRRLFEAAIDKDPMDLWAHWSLGQSYLKSRDFAATGRVARQMLERLPESPRGHELMADAARAAGDWAAAVQAQQSAQAMAPQDAALAVGLAQAFIGQGQPQAALAALNRALALRQRFKRAWMLKGEVLLNLGQADEAAACYGEAAELAPWDTQPQLALADLHRRAKRCDVALGLAAAVAQREPDNMLALRRWGEAARDQGDLALAAEKFRAVQKANGQDYWVRIDLAEVLRRLRQFQDAATVAAEAHLLRSDQPHALKVLGNLAMEQGDCFNAEAYFRRACAIDPTDGWGPYGLARALMRQGQFEAMLEAALVSRDLLPRHAATHWLVGSALAELHRYEDAEPYLRQALTLEPDMQVARRRLAEVLLARQMYDDALELAQAELGRNSADVWASDLRERALRGLGGNA